MSSGSATHGWDIEQDAKAHRKQAEKHIIKTKKYSIKMETADDGTSRLTRTNDGFNVMEMIGVLTSILHELMGPNLPTLEFEKVTRRIVEQEENPEVGKNEQILKL
jgi:hypothetical protein